MAKGDKIDQAYEFLAAVLAEGTPFSKLGLIGEAVGCGRHGLRDRIPPLRRPRPPGGPQASGPALIPPHLVPGVGKGEGLSYLGLSQGGLDRG